MSSNRLDELPPELCAFIVEYLELEDIRSLRLVSRALEHNATQARYKSFFVSKHVDMTRDGLEKFGSIISNSRFGRLLQDLTLVGIVYEVVHLNDIVDKALTRPKRPALGIDAVRAPRVRLRWDILAKAAQDLDILERRQADYIDFHHTGRSMSFLTETLRTLASQTSIGLRKLSILAAVYRSDAITRHQPSDAPCWIWVLEEAERTFTLVMTGLNCSNLPVRSLEIFTSRSSKGCGVPRNALTRFCSLGTSMHSPALTQLSVCISDQIMIEMKSGIITGHDEYGVPFTAHRSFPNAPQNPGPSFLLEGISGGISISAKAFANVLESCPNLEVMELSAYRQKFELFPERCTK